MRGRFSLFCYKMWPHLWGVCQRPFSIDELRDIYLMGFTCSSLCEKLFSLHCMCKRWLSSFYVQTIQSSKSTRGEGWGFAMKICPWGGEFHIYPWSAPPCPGGREWRIQLIGAQFLSISWGSMPTDPPTLACLCMHETF